MADEINFLDLAVITRITPNTPLEKLGGLINSSIFDASNIAGTLKQKSLIEFSANYPGPNSMNITEQGNALIREANERSADPFDKLDESILQHLSGGKRLPSELQSTLNIRPKDLALRLYKESKQGFVTYEIKNGTVEIMLTEKGFLKAKTDQTTPNTTGVVQSQGVQGTAPHNIQAQGIPTMSNAQTTQQNLQSNMQASQQTILQQSQSAAQSSSTLGQSIQNTGAVEKKMPELKNENKRWMTIGILIIILVVVYVLSVYVLK